MTGINNQLGQIGYDQFPKTGVEGQPHANLLSKRATNPLNPQVSSVTIGGSASDGDYTITIVDAQTGTSLGTATFTRGSGESNATIATELIDAVNGLASAPNKFTASSGGSGVVQIDFDHANKQYTVTAAAPGSGTATVATTETGGTDIPFGRFLVYSGDEAMVLPDGASPGDIRGVSVRDFQFVNQGSALASADDVIPPGSLFAAGFEGKIWLINNGSVASARGGSIFVVVNTAGGNALGEARADDDGANSVELDSRAAYWDEVVPANEGGWAYVRL